MMLGLLHFCLLFSPFATASFVSQQLRSLPPLGGSLDFLGSSFGVTGQNATYDYIILGGGTAGLAIATRLAQNVSNSVAVVEAGGFYELDNGNISVIPADATYYAGSSPTDIQPAIDWGFVTTPQSALNGREIHYARGKCLGGSSARNLLAYQRGTNQSYADWASAVDDDTYNFGSFIKYFQKSASFTPPNTALRAQNATVSFNPSAFTISGGPLQVGFPNWANPFSSYFRLGMEKIGFPQAVDFVSGTLMGVQYQMQTLSPWDQTRSTSESSYLRSAFSETDLTVYKNTLAKKILFDERKKAFGALINSNGMTFQINATKEVILSAGAFQSPQLLMVSGIGPKTTLNSFNISVVKDLPGVGQNMWDHWLFGPSYQVDVTTHSELGNAVLRAEQVLQYRVNHTGVLTNNGGDIYGWEKLPQEFRVNFSSSTEQALQQFPPDWPELEYIAIDAYAGNQENYIEGSPKTPYNYVAPVAALVSPLSRGNVTINSSDTSVAPLINPNWLSAIADQELAVAAYKRIRFMMDTDIMRSVTVGEELYPGRNTSSDAQILDTIKSTGQTVWHAAATNKMGCANDSMAVIDSRARVFGVSGLRVVDASSLPFLPPGHPQSTIYALAEKIADDIMTGR